MQLALTSHAVLPSEVYWNSMLPNTPMPKSIRDVLRPGGLCPVRVQWSVKIIVIPEK